MSIQEIVGNIKRFLSHGDTFLAAVLILVSLASFGLGRLSVPQNKPPVGIQMTNESATVLMATEDGEEVVPPSERLEERPKEEPKVAPIVSPPETPKYVGSKNGTKYHLPWCAGAQQIKEENKVWFGSKEEAAKAGYTPAANCKGI